MSLTGRGNPDSRKCLVTWYGDYPPGEELKAEYKASLAEAHDDPA
jgi:hypothetical protein